MTRADALAEARKRWGPEAKAYYYRGAKLYCVAKDDMSCFGSGQSYEAAFADADRRAK